MRYERYNNTVDWMLPKIENKKQVQSYYPKLPMASNNDENIFKLKLIQQFLEEDTYAQKITPLRHHKQSSLHSYRHVDQENIKKHVANASKELCNTKNMKSDKENCEKRQNTHRPKTKREGLRLSELIDVAFRENCKHKDGKQLNFRNYKVL